jgi:tRNA(adenine34) deaminase
MNPHVLSSLDGELMEHALQQARHGLQEGAMPIGAVLARDGAILAEAHWSGIDNGVLNHPEHVVLLAADARVPPGQRRQCALYTTLEPCLMCMGTAISFGVGRIVYALAAPEDGAADVAAKWSPQHGHPADGIPYSLPVIERDVKQDEARLLIEAWLETGVTGREAEFARRTLAAT